MELHFVGMLLCSFAAVLAFLSIQDVEGSSDDNQTNVMYLIQEMRRENMYWVTQNMYWRTRVEELEIKVKQNGENIKVEKHRMDSTQQSVKSNSLKLDSTQRRMAAVTDKVNICLTNATQQTEQELAQLRTFCNCKELESRMTSMAIKIAEHDEAITDISSLETRVNDMEVTVTDINTRLTDTEVTVNDINTRLALTETTVAGYETRIAANEASVVDLTMRVVSVEADVATLTTRMDAADATMADLQEQINNIPTPDPPKYYYLKAKLPSTFRDSGLIPFAKEFSSSNVDIVGNKFKILDADAEGIYKITLYLSVWRGENNFVTVKHHDAASGSDGILGWVSHETTPYTANPALTISGSFMVPLLVNDLVFFENGASIVVGATRALFHYIAPLPTKRF